MRSKVLSGLLVGVLVLMFAGSASANYYFYNKKNFYEKQNQKKDRQIKQLEEEVEALRAKSKAGPADEDADNNKSNDGDEEASADPNAPTLDTSGWQTYTSSKYGYSFKHPASYEVGVCDTKPDCGDLIIEQDEGDSVSLQGDISQTGWPLITISHYSTEFYNPADVMLDDWLASQRDWYIPYLPEAPNYLLSSGSGGYPAVKFTVPQTPQSYAIQYVYFTDSEGRMFEITMNDASSSDSMDFYDAFLYNFIAV